MGGEANGLVGLGGSDECEGAAAAGEEEADAEEETEEEEADAEEEEDKFADDEAVIATICSTKLTALEGSKSFASGSKVLAR